jgi:hypothetical protein
VAFRPPAAELDRDRLFYAQTYVHVGDASHWLEPMRVLARYGLSVGVEFHTDDMVQLENASVLIFGEIPASRLAVARLRKAYPHLKLVLQLLESPLGRAWTFDRANHSDFDAVISYNPRLYDGRRYFSFMIPVGGLSASPPPQGTPWKDRRIACLVAHVPNVRPLLIRRSGLGLIRQGWKFNVRTWWNYVSEEGSLYRDRLAIAKTCDEMLGESFEIFGPGWPEARAGSRDRQGFRSARGPFGGSKLELLQHYRFNIAYENSADDGGYVTEKLFDALLAGCVPVYLGNMNIERHVHPDAFVDARKFKNCRELVRFIEAMPKEEWSRMRDAGSAFLRDVAPERFGSMQYARSVVGAVRAVMSGHAA